MGYGAPNVSVSDVADGMFKEKTRVIRDGIEHDQAGVARMQDVAKLRGWKAAASCFLTTLNAEITKAAFIELTLLSSDKTLCVVTSAPSNYSSYLAMLLLYVCDEEPNAGIIPTKLIEMLEDERPIEKKISRIIEFASALMVVNSEFDDPDRFQKCLTRIKHALKGAALLKFRQSQDAEQDSVWAEKHLVAKGTSFNEMQKWKRVARQCIVHQKVPRIRWFAVSGNIEVCTDTKADTWCPLAFEQWCRLVHGCIDVVEQIIVKFGVTLYTEDELARLVESIRANTVGMQVRDTSGRWGPPSSCVSLAAQLMQIAPRTAERIHSEFQRDKCVPDVKGSLQRERPWLMETVFGKASIKQWVTEHLLTCVCVAKRQRTTYQSICDYLREVAPIHIQDTSSILLMEEDLTEAIEAACKVLHYQNVRRWCLKEGMKVTKLGKIIRTYSGENSKI